MRRSSKLCSIILSLGILASLALMVVSVGCSSSGGSASAMMEKMTWDTTQLTYINVEGLRNDSALEDLYDQWREDAGQMLSTHGIDRNSVQSMGYGSEVTIIMGSFDLAAVRHELDTREYNDDDYRGVEVWKKPYGNELTALMDGVIIIGPEDSVEDCIRVIQGGEDSFADKQNARDVMNKLPNGLFANLSMSNWFTGLLLGGFESLGISAQKADQYTLRFTFVLKFNDRGYAEDAMNKVEDFVEGSYRNVQARQDGEYVIVTGEIDVDDAGSMLEAR